MAGHPRVARTKFDLTVTIDGVTYRCAQVTTNFYLNKIPMASCTLAVGRHVHTLAPAKAHTALFTAGAGTKLLKKAEIRLIPVGDWEPMGRKWPGGALIFKGYVTGVGVRTMRGSIRPTVQIIHWLADLNFSSALSGQSHPSNPADLSWKSIYIGEGGSTDNGTPHFIHQSVAVETFTPGAIKNDFWGSCLHPFLELLSERDQIKALPGLGVGPADSNSQAQKALDLMKPGGPDYKPLSLQIGSTFDNEMALAIAGFLKNELAEAWWSTTIWNKLVNEFAAAFMFAVIPQVEQAMVAPYIPGTRELWKTIHNEEYNYIDTVSVIPRPIQAVAIYAGISGETGEGGTKNVAKELGIGGHYRPEGADEGMLMALRPSGWMAQIPAFGENASNTAFGDPYGSPEPIPTATTPDAGPKKGNEWDHTVEDAAIGSKDMFDRLAHAVYVQEVLRGRFGVVHGKLRFDIAPGSTVKVEGSADPFIGADALRPNLIGEVHRVTCSLNAEGSKAGTSFQVVHLRTEKENEEDTTSVEKHPLYDQVFKGSPLSEDLAFR
jgi:hypothetical protein